MYRRQLVLLLPLCLLCSHSATAGNGKLTGSIRDPLNNTGITAHVTLTGSQRSVESDSTGGFNLLDVTPGTYQVTITAIGYRRITYPEIRVSADQTVRLTVLLEPGEVELPEVVVEGIESRIDRTRTSAKTTFEGSEVEALPVANTLELISTAPGVFGPFIRGSLQFHSRVYVDGIDLTDRSAVWSTEVRGVANDNFGIVNHVETAYVDESTDPSLMTLNATATEQATIYAGMASADYGTAPGVITYTHRQGSGPWGGRLQVRVSQLGGTSHAGPSAYNDAAAYFARKDTLSHSTWAPSRLMAQLFTWTPGKYPYGGEPSFDAEFGTGGALGEGSGLFVSGRWFDLHGRLPAERTRKADFSAKLTLAPTHGVQLSILGVAQDRGQLLGWKNRTYDDYDRFYLEGVPLWDGFSAMGSVKLSHMLSASTFYELQIGLSYDQSRRGFCDDDGDRVLEPGDDGDYLTFDDTTVARKYLSWTPQNPRGVFGSSKNLADVEYNTNGGQKYLLAAPAFVYEWYTHRTTTLRGLLSSQVSRNHQLSLGAEVRLMRLDRLLRTTAAEWQNGLYNQEAWTRYPVEVGGYVQDRMEYGGLLANFGVRMDGFYPAASDYVDYFCKFGTNPFGSAPVRGPKAPMKFYLSPRFGISHPLSDRATVFFSVARTVSPIPYSVLYWNYNQFLGTVIRIDQSPLSSVTYDMGGQWQVSDEFQVSLGAYYKDMTNPDLALMQAYTGSPYNLVYSGAGFADCRGIEIALDFRGSESPAGMRARLSYTYSHMHGSIPIYSMNKYQYTPREADSLGIPGQLPFGLMQRYTSLYTDIFTGSSTALGGFNRKHQISLVLNLPLPFGFRLGAVGKFASGFYFPTSLVPDAVISYLPGEEYDVASWMKRVDLRLEKALDISGFGRLGVFVDITNAFNWQSVLAYLDHDQVTRLAWTQSSDPTGGPSVNRPVTRTGSLVYDVPREFYFGFNFTF